MSWCLEDQKVVVEQLLVVARNAESESPLAELLVVKEAAERIAKMVLVGIGTFRCSDVHKPIEDVSEFVTRILRKTVRVLAKGIRGIDLDEVSKKLGLGMKEKEVLEHIIDVATSRAKSGVQKALSDVYERLEQRFTAIRSMYASEGVSKFISDSDRIDELLDNLNRLVEEGLLRETEVENVAMITADVISSELSRAVARISRELSIPQHKVREVLEMKSSRSRVKEEIERAAKLMRIYTAVAIVLDLLSNVSRNFLDSSTPSQRVAHLLTSPFIERLPRFRDLVDRMFRELCEILGL